MKYTEEARELANIFKELKAESGSHSPSIDILCKKAGIDIKVDACFLSNPYATDLFMKEFSKRFPTVESLKPVFEYYPPQNRNIAEIVSEIAGVSKESILVGNGAQEIIEWLLSQHRKARVALPIPTYSSYYESITDDSEMCFYNLKETDGFSLDLIDYSDFLKSANANIAILINPNNPNGGYLKKQDVKIFCENNRHLDLILIDDSFTHFAYEDLDFGLVTNSSLQENFENVIVIKSMSKDFGVAGLRAGYAIMSSDMVGKALANGFLWNSNGFAFHFFDILRENNFQKKYEIERKRYIMNTLHMFKEMSAIPGVRIFPSMSNFYLVYIDEAEAGSFGFNLLANFGVYVRNCNDKIGLGNGFYRIASRSFEENLIIMDSIKDLLDA